MMSDPRGIRADMCKTVPDTKRWMEARLPTPDRPFAEVYAILLKGSETPERGGKPLLIGTVGAPRNEPIGAEIGYGLQAISGGRGRTTTRHTLFAEIDPNNTASVRVVEKQGFKRGEGELRWGLEERDGEVLRTTEYGRWYLHRSEV